MAIKIDDILMLFCVSGFFAGVVVAVTTLPVWAARRGEPNGDAQRRTEHCEYQWSRT